MFDFSFSEIAVIGAVALVVLGPEKLPKVARTAGLWISKAQRYVNDVKADIQREGELAELKKIQQQVQESAREIESSMQQSISSVESGLRQTASEVTSIGDSTSETTTTSSYEEPHWHDFVKPPPTNEELAAELATLKRSLAAGTTARFKYAPRARMARPLAAQRAKRRVS